MQADVWKKVEELFQAVRGQPKAARGEFLKHAYPGASEVRAEVQSLLDAESKAESFLESSPVSCTLRPGTKLGPFANQSFAQQQQREQVNAENYRLWRSRVASKAMGPVRSGHCAGHRCTSESVEAGTPRPLFDAALPSVPFSRYPYDLSPDGQRFLVLNATPRHSPGSLTVILNWTGLLKP
jgi:hypothetical protein